MADKQNFVQRSRSMRYGNEAKNMQQTHGRLQKTPNFESKYDLRGSTHNSEREFSKFDEAGDLKTLQDSVEHGFSESNSQMMIALENVKKDIINGIKSEIIGYTGAGSNNSTPARSSSSFVSAQLHFQKKVLTISAIRHDSWLWRSSAT